MHLIQEIYTKNTLSNLHMYALKSGKFLEYTKKHSVKLF